MPISSGIFRQNDIRGIVDRDLTVEAARAIKERGDFSGLGQGSILDAWRA